MILRRAVLLAALVPTTTLVAQSGGFSPVVLLLPSGPRTMALGNVGVASRDDEALFFNPAQLVIARGFSASAERYSARSGGGALSAVTRLHTGGIAVGMRMANFATLSPLAGNRASLSEGGTTGTTLEASIGVAQVYKSIRVGVAAKYAEENVSFHRFHRALFDVGLSKDFMRFYTAGFAVQNIGPGMTVSCDKTGLCTTPPGGGATPDDPYSTRVPLRTTLGVAGARGVGEFDVAGTVAVSLRRQDFIVPAGGIEVGYSWLDGYSIAVRAGARRPLVGEGRATAGAGFTMDRLSIDYALESLAESRFGHRVGLRVR